MKPIKFEISKDDTVETFKEKMDELCKNVFLSANCGKYEMVIRKPVRTTPQHRGMYLFCNWMAEVFNEINMRFSKKFIEWFFKEDFEMDWDKDMVKRLIWDPVMIGKTGKSSSTKLTTTELSKIAEYLKAHFAKLGIILNFPNIKDMQDDVKSWEIIKDKK